MRNNQVSKKEKDMDTTVNEIEEKLSEYKESLDELEKHYSEIKEQIQACKNQMPEFSEAWDIKNAAIYEYHDGCLEESYFVMRFISRKSEDLNVAYYPARKHVEVENLYVQDITMDNLEYKEAEIAAFLEGMQYLKVEVFQEITDQWDAYHAQNLKPFYDRLKDLNKQIYSAKANIDHLTRKKSAVHADGYFQEGTYFLYEPFSYSKHNSTNCLSIKKNKNGVLRVYYGLHTDEGEYNYNLLRGNLLTSIYEHVTKTVYRSEWDDTGSSYHTRTKKWFKAANLVCTDVLVETITEEDSDKKQQLWSLGYGGHQIRSEKMNWVDCADPALDKAC
jgi:hypothetical protein